MQGRAYQEAHFKLCALRDTARALWPRAAKLPSVRLLWQIVATTTDEMLLQLETRDKTPEAEALATAYADHADFFHLVLRFVEASEATRVPQALVGPLERLVQVRKPGARLVVWYDWKPSNYSFHTGVAANLSVAVEYVFGDVPGTKGPDVPPLLGVLSFPAAERDNVLMHAALAHEVGHALMEAEREANRPVPHIAVDESRCRELAPMTFAPRALPADLSQAIADALKRRATEVLKYWQEELLADAWAVHLLGPAALLALQALGAQRPSEDHPPTVLRADLMRGCLRRGGFEQAASECAWLGNAFAAAGLEAAGTKVGPADQAEFQLAWEALRVGLNQIEEFVFPRDGQANWYTAEQWGLRCGPSRLGRLITRLVHYVPPDRVGDQPGDYADLATILNAGWAVYLDDHHWGEFCAGLGDDALAAQHQARRKLHRLVLKAIESFYVASMWAEVHIGTGQLAGPSAHGR